MHDEQNNAIEFENVKCNWCLDSPQDTLKDITLGIEAEKLTAIIGQVGSGKVDYVAHAFIIRVLIVIK